MKSEKAFSGAPARAGVWPLALCSGLIVIAAAITSAVTGVFWGSAMIVAAAPFWSIGDRIAATDRNWLFDCWLGRNRFRPPERWQNRFH
ncbi:MAG: hypothetical protein AAGE01_18090 [Pseudomonadota bacterium]